MSIREYVTIHFHHIVGHAGQGQGRSEEGHLREDSPEQTLWRRRALAVVQTLDVEDDPSGHNVKRTNE